MVTLGIIVRQIGTSVGTVHVKMEARVLMELLTTIARVHQVNQKIFDFSENLIWLILQVLVKEVKLKRK